MTYKNAFNCKKCPQNNGPNGCPMWWETVWEKGGDGETKLIKACGYTQLPLYLTEVIKASNRPAAATESLRNQLALFGDIMRGARIVDAVSTKEIPDAERLGSPLP